jgi:hypothetical protein
MEPEQEKQKFSVAELRQNFETLKEIIQQQKEEIKQQKEEIRFLKDVINKKSKTVEEYQYLFMKQKINSI